MTYSASFRCIARFLEEKVCAAFSGLFGSIVESESRLDGALGSCDSLARAREGTLPNRFVLIAEHRPVAPSYFTGRLGLASATASIILSYSLSIAVSRTNLIQGMGCIALLVMALLDGSIVPTLGSLDQFAGILAARHQPLWIYYAAIATLGGVIGSFTTYRLGRGAGPGGLQQRFGVQPSLRAGSLIGRWGFWAVFLPALAPPPFPSSVLFFAAGSLNYRAPKYIFAVGLGKAIRYGAITYVVSHYHFHFLRYLFHPVGRETGALMATFTVFAAAEFAFLLLGRRRKANSILQKDGVSQSTD